ncbi:CoA-binding protein [Muricauda sp. JGD-17]|uniref:CoA-binding protein n=1 Tax=Flagellimonas ochracea TaxID=2696472 RepID=A0A964WYW5_9FLAO|nr:CoA-binding protein [Allomuricauda ochracea]NAY93278.1 CoA-binding protein [Allomuricauda ochracea]
MGKALVFGASLKPNRYSNLAILRLVEKGIDAQAFGLREGIAHGVPIINNLDEFEDIDTVTLYLNPGRQSEYYQAILNLAPRRVIFNPGTENPEFYEMLRKAGIQVEVACTLVLLATGQY